MNFNDVKSPITERLSNPFIFSFLFSWIIWNWRIVLCLFWFDSETLKALGYASQISYIQSIYNEDEALYKPLISALIYTLGFPYLKSCIKWWQTYAQVWGEKQSLEASKGASVSFEKYLEKREEIQKLSSEMHDFFENEKVALAAKDEEIDELEKELETAYGTIEQLEVDKRGFESQSMQKEAIAEAYKDAFNVTKFDGDWKIEITRNRTEIVLTQLWRIYNGNIQRNEVAGTNQEVGVIRKSYWDPNTRNWGILLLQLQLNRNNASFIQEFGTNSIGLELRIEPTQTTFVAEIKGETRLIFSKLS